MSIMASRSWNDFGARPETLIDRLGQHGYDAHLVLAGEHSNFGGLTGLLGGPIAPLADPPARSPPRRPRAARRPAAPVAAGRPQRPAGAGAASHRGSGAHLPLPAPDVDPCRHLYRAGLSTHPRGPGGAGRPPARRPPR